MQKNCFAVADSSPLPPLIPALFRPIMCNAFCRSYNRATCHPLAPPSTKVTSRAPQRCEGCSPTLGTTSSDALLMPGFQCAPKDCMCFLSLRPYGSSMLGKCFLNFVHLLAPAIPSCFPHLSVLPPLPPSACKGKKLKEKGGGTGGMEKRPKVTKLSSWAVSVICSSILCWLRSTSFCWVVILVLRTASLAWLNCTRSKFMFAKHFSQPIIACAKGRSRTRSPR